jgi:hypothetical protein
VKAAWLVACVIGKCENEFFLLNEYRGVESTIKEGKWNEWQCDGENNQQRKI